MNRVLLRCVPLAFCVVALLAGCSQPSGEPGASAEQQKAAAAAAAAERNLATYRQLLKLHNDEMVVTMGKDIVQRFPDSAAAKEVMQTLPAIEKRYKENSEKNRLAALWTYQVAPMAGGTQSTASIYSEGNDGEPVRLVLRRHTSWGQSAFLYGSKPGFVCRRNCTIAGRADGKPVRIKAFAPDGGEPALMIRDDKAFIALLEKTRKLELDVTLVDGTRDRSLVYEVGGFDPAKWQPVGKAARR